ncbi:MAG TPA: LysM peptidoglycan-binding domain-containing protein [Anaerolineales bacterium]|nr:LysM peptidoglycan-binding domain-containing protein [Anaerolineales bacterium]
MPDSIHLAKAELRELDARFENEINADKKMIVQFNPDSLKVSFANQLQTSQGDQNGPQTRQFVGAGTTKLSVTLWFDVNAPQPEDSNVGDVRKLTQKVAYFITPRPDDTDRTKLLPPAVRFVWGSFRFDGMMDSMEENIEFFSNEGIPLRASVTLALSQQRITEFAFAKEAAPPPGIGSGNEAVGTRPLAQAASGASLQSIASASGKNDWQSIAAANGIENPRLLQVGQLIDLNA